MSTKTKTEDVNSWNELATHDWSGEQSIETTVSTALLCLTSTDGNPLYDYIDLEAVADALGSEASGRGASEIRFDYEDYEIRIRQDGTIASREQSVTQQPVQ